jgi:superfamily II DNA or RNA helicase
MKLIFKLPPVLAIDERWGDNSIQQLAEPCHPLEATLANYTNPPLKGKVLIPTDGGGRQILVIEKPSAVPDHPGEIILAKLNRLDGDNPAADLSEERWLRHPKLAEISKERVDYKKHLESVLDSWAGAFSYVEEDLQAKTKGLRAPQAGAVYAVHAHWLSGSTEAATIVMPTGTGKTETMLSVLISKPCRKLLVVVPTDALRTQIGKKFLTLGILKDHDCHVLLSKALYPVVGILRQKPKSAEEVDAFFEKCNVVVTTSQIVGQCEEEVQERIASHCPFLFIDEAHHIAAPTWSAFKKKFSSGKTLQFTATPFREDDKPVEGKMIFKYPLKKAQEEGYFKPIRFQPIVEFDLARADEMIAAKAVEQLCEDEKYGHILMARVGSIERAAKVFSIYERYKEFNPVQIHTGIKSKKERDRIRRKILNGESKIVVCVDMLGEGFDLPELKIAAFHDIRKGLAVTLQLAGRFTRSRPDLGEATFIANIADVNVREELRKLYRRDTDWNFLLPQLSEEIIEEQACLREFAEGFSNFPDDIPLVNIRPAMSTVIYRTKCEEWAPESFRRGIPGIASFERVHYDINQQNDTLLVVTARKIPIDWADIKEIFNWDWELYILYWDRDQNLLFIHNSSNGGEFKSLARAVAGDVELVEEQVVFRCFSGVNRLKLQNVGLTEQFGRLVRYTGRMGSDVEPGLTEVQKRNARKTVLFGTGFEHGKKVSIGASRKGRIWSFATTNVELLTRWCKSVGKKVLDETIDPDEVLKGTLESEIVSERPPKMPIGADWPEVIYKDTETAFSFVLEDGTELQLLHSDLTLKDPTEDGELKLEISSRGASIEITLTLFEEDKIKDCRFSVIGGRKVQVRHRSSLTPLEDFFYEYPPVIWFVDGSSLEGNKLTSLRAKYPPYDRQKIQPWDWTGVNLRRESQGITKKANSIQFKVIAELKKGNYDVIFDDDDKGEAADVVAVHVEEKTGGGRTIDVEFYHCKFSKSAPGERIKDLYEVCGQAQKSIHWMESHDKQVELFTHLLRREPRRRGGRDFSRFEKGDRDELIKIREISRVCPIRLKIFIVQPGLSKGNASVDQLELLSVTENHLMETYNLPFVVIASP